MILQVGIYYGLGEFKVRMTHDVIALVSGVGKFQVFEVFEEKPLGSASIAQVQGVAMEGDVTFQVARKPEKMHHVSKVVSTHRTGTHPFRNLYQQAIMGFLS